MKITQIAFNQDTSRVINAPSNDSGAIERF